MIFWAAIPQARACLGGLPHGNILNTSPVYRALHASDTLLLPNLALARMHWPEETTHLQSKDFTLVASEYKIALITEKANPKTSPASLQWTIADGVEQKLKCEVFGQESDLAEIKKLKEMEISSPKARSP